MGYRYVYVITGIAAVAVLVLFFAFYQQPTPQVLQTLIPTGRDSLTLCDTRGTSPFMEGFYLQGAQPGTLKTWHWGDNSPDETTMSVVMNHNYRLAGNVTDRQFNGSVTEWEYVNPAKISDRENFTVYVTNSNLRGNYDQFEGAIIQGDYAGFTVGFPSSNALYSWYWDKNNPDDSDLYMLEDSNPGHKYPNIGRYQGNVAISSPDISEGKDFCVLVLSDMRNVTGVMEVNDSMFYISSSVGLAGDDMVFTVQLAPAPGLITMVTPTHSWSFGDNSTKVHNTDATVHHRYANNGTFLVQANVTDPRGYVTLSKTVVILKPSITVSPSSGPKTTKIVVHGTQFPDGNFTGMIGTSLLLVENPRFAVTVKNGTFTVDYQIPSGVLNGSKNIYVEYLPTGKVFASANFTVTGP